jgi:hypothetical protein
MTPMPTTSTRAPVHAYTAIAQRHKDGSVLLSVNAEKICRVNGVGALVWVTIEESGQDLTVDDTVQRLSERFEAINREGVLLYDVSPEKLRQDIAGFLDQMTKMKLLQVMIDPHGRQVYRIPDGVSATTSAPDLSNADIAAPAPSQPVPPFSRPQFAAASTTPATPGSTAGQTGTLSADDSIKPLKRETFMAFLGLAAFDVLLRTAGFEALIRKVERYPTAEPQTTDSEICKRVRAVVDRAQMYYPKKAMCLQHSSVVTCLLRRRGVPAEMVIGAQEYPPKGHAWAEVMDEVVNDSQRVKTRYRELRRL